MKDNLNKIIQSIRELTNSEITYLIEFSNLNISFLSGIGDQKYFDEVSNKVNNKSLIDFSKMLNDSLIQDDCINILENNFEHNDSNYLLISASKQNSPVTKPQKEIFDKLSVLVKEFLFESVSNSPSDDNYFHLFSESTSDIVFILDRHGSFIFVNKTLIDQSHFRSEEIVGKHFFEIISEQSKPQVAESFQKIVGSRITVNFNVEILPKVGIEQLYEIILTPVVENHQVTSLLGVGKNLSKAKAEKIKVEDLIAKLTEANRLNAIERDRAQQQISVLNELNNLKNEFISNVSHELRTPLASIIGFAETITEDKNLTLEKAKEFNEIILTESKRLAKLINDVLDFSELESEKQKLLKTSVNIINIINESIDTLKKECDNKKITLTRKIPQSEIMIFADEERIKKIVLYILSNAIKFTNSNGRITVIVQEFLKEVEIVISDTGVGIPEQKIPVLFDKFSKINRVGQSLSGAGFGLVTVKQIIDLHKGLIRVKSEVNKGTSFIIRLPKYSFN